MNNLPIVFQRWNCIFFSYVFIIVIPTFVVSCSLLNEKIGPEVDSCSSIPGPNICKDNIIASCVDGLVNYTFCEDNNQICVFVDTKRGYRCGCVSDSDCKDNEKCIHNSCVQLTEGVFVSLTKTKIIDDDNNNGLVEPGEKITVDAWLKNSGTKDAYVEARIDTKDKDVTWEKEHWNTVLYGTIKPGEEIKGKSGWWEGAFCFNISKDAKSGKQIEFFLDIKPKCYFSGECKVGKSTFAIQVK